MFTQLHRGFRTIVLVIYAPVHITFLIVGSAGIIWYAAWLLLVFNTPADHPRISSKEQHYIETTIKEEIVPEQGDTYVSAAKVIVKLLAPCMILILTESITSLETYFNISSSYGNCNS